MSAVHRQLQPRQSLRRSPQPVHGMGWDSDDFRAVGRPCGRNVGLQELHALIHLLVIIPSKAVSVLNTRECWQARSRRAKTHRTWAYRELRALQPGPCGGNWLPIVVTLTRVAPRRLDGDNLQASLKATRDGVADWLGVDDADSRIRWQYEQRKGDPKTYAIEIEVTA